jgi:hypothetical protein
MSRWGFNLPLVNYVYLFLIHISFETMSRVTSSLAFFPTTDDDQSLI